MTNSKSVVQRYLVTNRSESFVRGHQPGATEAEAKRIASQVGVFLTLTPVDEDGNDVEGATPLTYPAGATQGDLAVGDLLELVRVGQAK